MTLQDWIDEKIADIAKKLPTLSPQASHVGLIQAISKQCSTLIGF